MPAKFPKAETDPVVSPLLSAHEADEGAHGLNVVREDVEAAQSTADTALDTADAAQSTANTAFETAGAAVPASEKGEPNGIANLDAQGKVPVQQLPNSVMEYKGSWNAATNSPTLADGTGNAGDVYVVSTGGTRNLGSGNQTFAIKDWVVHDGAAWQQVDNTDDVTSVAGKTGAVTLTTADLPGLDSTLESLMDSLDVVSNTIVPAMLWESWRLAGASGQPAYGPNAGTVGGQPTPQFRRKGHDLLGWEVELGGMVNLSSLSNGELIFTLPSGYIPSFLRRFSVTRQTGTSNATGQVQVQTNGDVTWNGPGTGSGNISLDGIRFSL